VRLLTPPYRRSTKAPVTISFEIVKAASTTVWLQYPGPSTPRMWVPHTPYPPSLRRPPHVLTTTTQITGRFDQDIVTNLPSSLKFICHNGAGYDSIDATACAARGLHLPISLSAAHLPSLTPTLIQASPSPTPPAQSTPPQPPQQSIYSSALFDTHTSPPPPYAPENGAAPCNSRTTPKTNSSAS